MASAGVRTGGNQCVVACCRVLSRVVTCCHVLSRVVACCGVLWRVVACCGVLWRVLACCGVLWRVVACCEVWDSYGLEGFYFYFHFCVWFSGNQWCCVVVVRLRNCSIA